MGRGYKDTVDISLKCSSIHMNTDRYETLRHHPSLCQLLDFQREIHPKRRATSLFTYLPQPTNKQQAPSTITHHPRSHSLLSPRRSKAPRIDRIEAADERRGSQNQRGISNILYQGPLRHRKVSKTATERSLPCSTNTHRKHS